MIDDRCKKERTPKNNTIFVFFFRRLPRIAFKTILRLSQRQVKHMEEKLKLTHTVRSLYKRLDRKSKDSVFYFTLQLCEAKALKYIWDYTVKISTRGKSYVQK